LPHKHMVVGSNPTIATNVIYFKRCSSADRACIKQNAVCFSILSIIYAMLFPDVKFYEMIDILD
jgi:hypothetical protein